jgi:CRISPR-associated nuclease/helicase Cas3-like protein
MRHADGVGVMDEHTTSILHGGSIDVIVLHRDADGVLIQTKSGLRQVDLNEDMSQDIVADLLDCSVTLIAPAGVPVEVLNALTREQVPPAFRSSAWLRQHRALIFTDGRCTVGSVDLCYRTELGVYPDDIR